MEELKCPHCGYDDIRNDELRCTDKNEKICDKCLDKLKKVWYNKYVIKREKKRGNKKWLKKSEKKRNG